VLVINVGCGVFTLRPVGDPGTGDGRGT